MTLCLQARVGGRGCSGLHQCFEGGAGQLQHQAAAALTGEDERGRARRMAALKADVSLFQADDIVKEALLGALWTASFTSCAFAVPLHVMYDV